MQQEKLHEKIVGTILPAFAERLKKDGVICSYDRKPFAISLFEDSPPIRIIPDLVVHLPDRRKVLVEVANPRDPKRFLGEMVYPYLLKYHKEISRAIIYVLHDREQQRLHDRSLVLRTVLVEIFGRITPTAMASWPGDETIAYDNLKYVLTSFARTEIDQEAGFKTRP
jgi:hypothetical protein